jgi:hypothetical protein
MLYTCSQFEEYKGKRKRENMKEYKKETKRGRKKRKIQDGRSKRTVFYVVTP